MSNNTEAVAAEFIPADDTPGQAEFNVYLRDLTARKGDLFVGLVMSYSATIDTAKALAESNTHPLLAIPVLQMLEMGLYKTTAAAGFDFDNVKVEAEALQRAMDDAYEAGRRGEASEKTPTFAIAGNGSVN